MGHSVSKGRRGAQNDSLVRDVTYLREQISKHEKAYEELQLEHERLKNKVNKQDQEFEKVKEENIQLKQALASVTLDTQVLSQAEIKPKIDEIKPKIDDVSDTDSGVNVEQSRLLKVGDKVLSLHKSWAYYTATIASFDAKTLMYTVNWDDGDPSGRVQKYFNVALNRTPAEDEIAMGTLVLFPQGQYGGTEGNNSGGIRYHQGRITRVYKGPLGEKLYDGVHTKGDNDGKWVTYSGYNYEFKGLTINELRVSPNILDILNAQETHTDSGDEMGHNVVRQDNDESAYDVYISYSKLNSNLALENGEVGSLERSVEEQKTLNGTSCDPRWIKQELVKKGLRVWMDESQEAVELNEVVNIMKRCQIIISCISNEYANSDNTRMELQFSKKTIKKAILPIVVGGGEWEWQLTVVGLLIAGELYIDFTDSSKASAKMEQLMEALAKYVHVQERSFEESPKKSITTSKAPEVFISYCWTNSKTAFEAREVKQYVGNAYNDPRRIYTDLAKRNINGWIDIHQLTSAAAESIGMFEVIAKGLSSAKLVLVFVSDEYSESDNCRMEFQFALKSLKKKVVPVIVGTGNKWSNTIIGMLVGGCDVSAIDMREIEVGGYEGKLEEIIKYCSVVQDSSYQTPGKERTYRAPTIGDKVISHHFKWAYFPATIVAFDKTTFEYTVDWDDGDPSGRSESYKNVALNSVPRSDEIAVGTIVFFPQGSYAGSEGNNTGGVRYHQGKVTKVYKNSSEETLYDGQHTKGETDGKWITYKGYNYQFTGMRLKDLRISPNAMDAMMAIERQAQQL